MGILGAAGALPGAQTLRRNVLLDLVSLVGVGITASVVLSLLPGVARHAGLDPVGIALLAAAPFAANVLGLFAGRLGPRTPRGMSLFRAGGALMLVVDGAAARAGRDGGPGPGLLDLARLLQPAPAADVGRHVPQLRARPAHRLREHRQGRRRGHWPSWSAASWPTSIGGMVVVAFAGAIGALCAMSASRIQAPLDRDARRFSARESWAAFRRRPALRQVATAQAFYGAGLIAAGPLYALVQVDRLSLSMAEIGIIGILGAVATTLSCLAWGNMADRRGSVSVMRIGATLGVVSIVLYAVAPVGRCSCGPPRSSLASPTPRPTWGSRR